jgi:hypothetical protein
MYLHEPKQEKWFALGYFPHALHTFHFPVSNKDGIAASDLIIIKHSIKKLNNQEFNCHDISASQQMTCVIDKTREQLINKAVNCTHPWFEPLNLPYSLCQNEEQIG